MKETNKSIKMYFYFVGVFTLYSGYSSYLAHGNSSVIIHILFGLAFLYFGVKIDYYIKNKTDLLVNFVILNFVINSLAYLMLKSFSWLIITVAISLYLINNIKRLSKNSEGE